MSERSGAAQNEQESGIPGIERHAGGDVGGANGREGRSEGGDRLPCDRILGGAGPSLASRAFRGPLRKPVGDRMRIGGEGGAAMLLSVGTPERPLGLVGALGVGSKRQSGQREGLLG